jgi:hypothetical protein
MRQLLDLAKRFHHDERGIFAVVFGILAIVLVATAGAVVDFTTVEQYRARAQDALDSAALGLQPTIFTAGVTEDTILPEAQLLLDERLDTGIDGVVDDVTINVTDGMLRLEANITIPTAFVALVGVPSLRARIVSEATRKRLNIEVAMVLDNSGSMAQQSRMPNLITAANCAVGILMNSDCDSVEVTSDSASVKIGIVPFTSFVNVGTANASADWMDKGDGADLANDNFDDDDNDATAFSGAVNRFDLYDQLDNVDWEGCVEARKYPYDTNDVYDPLLPDTKFVPEFAPDNPSTGSYDNSYLADSPSQCNITIEGTCNWVRRISGCNSSGTSCSGSWSTLSSTSLTLSNGTVTTGSSVCSCPTSVTPTVSITSSFFGYRRTETRNCGYTQSITPTGLSNRELQERLCKYHGSISTSNGKGPNQDCPYNALTPLTNTKATITAAINDMSPQGYTNIHQGTIWGFHMLTSTEPLTEARPDSDATYKVMIVMTDGENTYPGDYNSGDLNLGEEDGGGTKGYWAYGYPWNNPAGSYSWPTTTRRMASSTYPNPTSESEMVSALNSRTEETCTNAKAAGITIYTIGLNSPNQTTTDMLTNCATDASHAYFPTQSSELITVFQEIAAQLSDLRLAR